jgi:glycosyltransferase involved in cell wall biosynthesis
MRILIFNWRDLDHPLAGGAEVYTDHVAHEWVRRGHAVTVFCSAVAGRPEREITANGYRVVRRGGIHGVYREARAFWDREGRGNFDLVVDEVNTRPFGCPNWISGVPVVAVIHQVAREVWFHETSLPVALVGRYWLERRWLSDYRDVPTVTLSESSRQSLEQYGLRKVSVVAPGFRQQAQPAAQRPTEDPTKEEVPTFVFVGRLSSNKRPQDAIRAIRHARRSLPEARLWVLGTGPMDRRLRRRPRENVEFFGYASDAEKLELMSRAHALLVTSVREGWGLVVTEAASVGTPSIGYDVPGLRDSIPASGGILVEPTPRSLSARIVEETPRLLSRSFGVAPRGVTSWDAVADGVLAAVPSATLPVP